MLCAKLSRVKIRKSFLLIILTLAAIKTSAILMRPLSIEELSQKANLILNGTIISKSCERDNAGRIFTKHELQVTEVWKGSLETNLFIIVHSGGTIGDERADMSGEASFDVGEEIVAFLVVNQRGQGVSIGLAQGKFTVSRDENTGEKLVRNLFHGRTDGHAAPDKAIAAGRLTLADLKRQAQRGAK